MNKSILSINVGSSSIKFALYQQEGLLLLLQGKMDFIGQDHPHFTFQKTEKRSTHPIVASNACNHMEAAEFLIGWLESQEEFQSIGGIGHRLVHGMRYREPQLIDARLLEELHSFEPYAPNHLPHELKLIEAFAQRSPHLHQVACFDTSFHQTMPAVAKALPLPRRYRAKGLERYGFHGLSYEYLMEELKKIPSPLGKQRVHGKVILAHLGNGASLAAVNQGKSIDTSMGFTPTSGLVMGSRSGDLDPGIASFLEQTEKMTSAEFVHMVNKESGLLGMSETSSNVRKLLAIEKADMRAQEALELFCYQTKKWIGAYVAVLGGLDTLVFSGGIGENAPLIRARICSGLAFLGLDLSDDANLKNAPVISSETSRVIVRMIPTNEELIIARSMSRILTQKSENEIGNMA